MSDTPRLLDDSVAIAQQIDQLCDAFEADWSAGQAPSIENFLVRVAEVDREQLLRELLAIDLLYRTKNGEQPQPAEYIARFPSLDPAWMDQVTCSMSSGDTQVVARHRADHSERPADESGLTDRFLRHLSRQSQFGTHWSAVDSTGAAELKGTANVEELIALLEPATEPNELGRLGSFRVLKVLGRGGMGVVFLAEDTQLRRHVALKLLHPGYSREGDAVERFMREARAAAAVRHDNIVTIFQVGHVNGVPFLAQELLEGETLDDRLRRQEKLPIRHALCIGREIAAGLAAAHARGLLHRDIKPSNIWLETSHHSSTAAFRTKLLDFGLARVASDDTQLTTSGMIVGTPAFMSPEQAQGKSVDIRSDLFNLGCVLYRMVTGEMPFQGTDTLSMLRSLAIDVPLPARELNPEITSELSDFIAKLLHKDPLQRAGSAEFVASRLAAIASTLDGPPAGHSSSPISRSIAGHITRTPRRLAVALGLGVILSLLAAAIIITITRPDGSKTEIRVDGDAKVEVAIVNSKPRVNSVEGPLPQADEWAGNKSSVPPAVVESSPKPSQPQPLFDNDFSSDQILQARVRAKMLEPSMLDIFSIEDGSLIIQASPGGQGTN